MTERNRNNLDFEKSHSQFESEIFLKYLEYFSNLKIKYVDAFDKNFFDRKTNLLKLPKNPSFEQMEIIINYLDELVKYRLGVTAKRRLELEKFKIKKSSLDIQNNFENACLSESVCESGKKQVYDTMLAPNSEKLLKDVLDLEKLSKEFNEFSLKQQKKVVYNILNILGQYDSASNKGNDGGLPMKFLENKKLYCIGYSYLADIIFEKLKIKHYVASGIIPNGKKKMPHSISVIKLKNKYFIFDPSSGLGLSEVKIKNNFIDFRNKKDSFYSGYIFSLGNPETEIIAQNLLNLSAGRYDREKYLKYILKISPNNVIAKYFYKKLKK